MKDFKQLFFIKLSYKNKLLYVADNEIIIVNCKNDQESSTQMSEAGRNNEIILFNHYSIMKHAKDMQQDIY